MKGLSRKRTRLFETGVRAYQKVFGDSRRIYVCPTCERGFDAIALSAGILTLDHVPPKALAGKSIVLTCKDCNSTAGHTLDSALESREHIRRFNRSLITRQGDYAGRVRFEVGGVRLNADLTINGEELTVNVLTGINDPNDVARSFQHLEKLAIEGAGFGERYRVTPARRVHVRRSAVGELRAAYLVAFARLGYRYALHPRLDRVRQQIREPDRQIISGTIVNEAEAREPRLVLLHEPFLAVAVVFQFTTTVLPWLAGPEDVYEELARRYQPNERISISGTDLGWPSTMQLALDFDSE